MPRLLKGSWIDNFLAYTDKTEIPRAWLEWSAINTIACSIKRNVHIWYRGIKFFPNQYVILVGPPGIGKGEAINAAQDIAKAAGTVNYLSDWHTPQEMIDEIATGYAQFNFKPGQISSATIGVDRSVCILAKELPVLLQSYESLHSIFCAWWDQNEFEYKTKNKGKYLISEMCVSILGGCVPDYIRSLGKDRLAPITGGFTARTIFVYETKKRQLIKSNFGRPIRSISKLKDDLTNDLQHINTLQGELQIDTQAEAYWQTKYLEHNRQNGCFDSDASANFKSRISSHLVKTAIAICVSESDSLTVTEDHLRRATSLIEKVRDDVDIVFRAVGESPIAVGQNRVLEFIRSRGLVSYNEILKFNYRHVTNDQLIQIVYILEKAGLIEEYPSGNNIMCYKAL